MSSGKLKIIKVTEGSLKELEDNLYRNDPYLSELESLRDIESYQESSGISNLCSACNQDHLKPLQKWCDRSDIEVEIEKLQAENFALRAKVSEFGWDGALNEAEDKNSMLQRKLDLAVRCLLRIQTKRYGCCGSEGLADEALVQIRSE